MARIRIPDGDGPEIARVWSLRPELGGPVAELSGAVYGESKLPARVRESVRLRIGPVTAPNRIVCGAHFTQFVEPATTIGEPGYYGARYGRTSANGRPAAQA